MRSRRIGSKMRICAFGRRRLARQGDWYAAHGRNGVSGQKPRRAAPYGRNIACQRAHEGSGVEDRLEHGRCAARCEARSHRKGVGAVTNGPPRNNGRRARSASCRITSAHSQSMRRRLLRQRPGRPGARRHLAAGAETADLDAGQSGSAQLGQSKHRLHAQRCGYQGRPGLRPLPEHDHRRRPHSPRHRWGSAFAVYVVGSRVINPFDTSWLSGDPAHSQLGWAFFRHEPLSSFPLGWSRALGYPLGEPIAWLDCVPIVAMLLWR